MQASEYPYCDLAGNVVFAPFARVNFLVQTPNRHTEEELHWAFPAQLGEWFTSSQMLDELQKRPGLHSLDSESQDWFTRTPMHLWLVHILVIQSIVWVQ